MTNNIYHFGAEGNVLKTIHLGDKVDFPTSLAVGPSDSLIYVLAVLCIAGTWRFALTGRGRGVLPVCLAFPVLIGLGLVLNQGDCI